jgi:4-hydroxy-tetrahydrodipicolinate synthase
MSISKSPRLTGVYAPVLTPFDSDLAVDVQRYVEHCRWLTLAGAGLAIFGTNSEAASVTADERISLTDAIVAAGIPPSSLMPGTGACALPEAVRLTRHAVEIGAPAVLILPPFFYKNLSDDGVFAYYAEIIERVGDSRLSVYLYHIPQMSHVPISLSLIERLLARYPKSIAGAKDSSGDWENSAAMMDNFAAEEFGVFPASESFLTRALARGGAGCISATVNVNPVQIRGLFDALKSGNSSAATRQIEVDAVRQVFQSVPMIPAMKAAVAADRGQSSWRTLRPPLVAMTREAETALFARLQGKKFDLAPREVV